MKIVVELTKEQIEDIIDELNYYFNVCESPAYCNWSLDSDNYSEEEKAWIKESPRIVSLLNLGNQLAEFL